MCRCVRVCFQQVLKMLLLLLTISHFEHVERLWRRVSRSVLVWLCQETWTHVHHNKIGYNKSFFTRMLWKLKICTLDMNSILLLHTSNFNGTNNVLYHFSIYLFSFSSSCSLARSLYRSLFCLLEVTKCALAMQNDTKQIENSPRLHSILFRLKV